MTRLAESPPELAVDLAALLERHAEEIASACVEALLAFPGSHFQTQPREELRLSARRQTSAMVAALNAGSDAESDAATDHDMLDVARALLGQGFDIAEVIQAALLWRDYALPLVWDAYSDSPTTAIAAARLLDTRVRYEVGRVGHLYAEAMRRDLEEQERRTALLLHAVQAASSSLELDQVLQRVGKVLVEAVGVRHCGLYLLDSSERVLEPRVMVGDLSESRLAVFRKGIRLEALFPLYASVLRTGQPEVVDDAVGDARMKQDAVQALGVRSLLVVPVRAGERVLGLAALASFDEPRAFSQEEVELAEGVVGAVALAIENARLYEETRRLYKQEEQLAIVEERQRIARELHDSVTQGLYAVTLYSEAASLHLASGELSTLSEHIREIQSISQQALREMRLLIFELRPPILEKEGLVAALQARLDSVEGRGGIETTLRVEGEVKLTRAVEEELYRIAQEALNNVLKHSRAKRVAIALRFSPERVCLEVSDDGVGFDPSVLAGAGTGVGKGGLGLKGMSERARQVGGCLSVESAPGQGTRVRLEVPSGQGSV